MKKVLIIIGLVFVSLNVSASELDKTTVDFNTENLNKVEYWILSSEEINK